MSKSNVYLKAAPLDRLTSEDVNAHFKPLMEACQQDTEKELAQKIIEMIDAAYQETEDMGSTRTFHGLYGLIYDIERICKKTMKGDN